MNLFLPTISSQDCDLCDFLDSLKDAFSDKSQYDKVVMYFYGATWSGWNEISKNATAWLGARKGRSIQAFVGTDHALTEPEALAAMRMDGVEVHLLVCYSGVYHPKLVAFHNKDKVLLLSGSNNLTRRGLSKNIEFATSVVISSKAEKFLQWGEAIKNSSDALTDDLLNNYQQQRDKRKAALRNANVEWGFTWKKRRQTKARKGAAIDAELPIKLEKDVLLYEVMPKETGANGSQIQIVKPVALGFFDLPNTTRESITVELKNTSSGEKRSLKMTYNENTTMRLSLHEASYTERPCFIIFKKVRIRKFEFCVISEALDPVQFQALNNRLGPRKSRVRRYEIVASDIGGRGQ